MRLFDWAHDELLERGCEAAHLIRRLIISGLLELQTSIGLVAGENPHVTRDDLWVLTKPRLNPSFFRLIPWPCPCLARMHP